MSRQDTTSKKRSDHMISVLNRYQQIYESSPEWGKIQYRLRMSYSNISIKLLKVFSIVNTNNENKFMGKNENKVMLDVFIPNNYGDQSKEDFMTICEKGFTEVLQFQYGQIDLRKTPKEADDYYEIMFCKVAIGTTYIFPAKDENDLVPRKEKPDKMTDQFDTLFLYDENYTLKEFRQTYITYKPSENVLPLYVIHFTINEEKYQEFREKPFCELCEENIAKKYCETEETYFCINCDTIHHTNKVSHKHKRTDLSEKPKAIGFCPVLGHGGVRLQLFCLQCNRPLCVNCKIIGDHSEGEKSTHKNIRVLEKYQITSKQLHQVDETLKAKKRQLIYSVNETQNRLKQINTKSNQVQDRLTEIMQRALKQLQSITKIKMSQLMSDHIQLKRQLDEIQWMEGFIRHEHELLSPDDFLFSWERYMNFKRSAIANSFTTTRIMPNMRVQGSVAVVADDEAGKNTKGEGSRQQSQPKSSIFKKVEDKNSFILRTKINSQKDMEHIEQVTLKSKNNLLNLSIFKNL